MQAKYWLSRAYAAAFTMSVAAAGLFESEKLAQGYLLLALMLLVSLVALVDVLVNDILPKDVTLACARAARPLIYMSLAICNMVVGIVTVKSDGFTISQSMFWVTVCVCTALAFQDVYEKHRT